MDRITVDLVIDKQLVRLMAWPTTIGPSRWRAAQLLPRDGRFDQLANDGWIEAPTPAEAIARLVGRALVPLLPSTAAAATVTPASPVVLSAPAPVAPAPAPVTPSPAPTPTIAVPSTLTREERAAQLKQTVEDAIARLAQQLSDGHSQEFLRTMAFYSRFWKYSLGNLLLIQHQKPEATQVAGVRKWNDLGYTVKKGEKGIWIWCPITKKEPDPDTGELVEVVVGFRPGVVFDASQLAEIAEKPLPELFAKLPDDVEALYQSVARRIEGSGIVVEERPLPSGIQGMSLGGVILIRPGLDSRNRLFVVLHELAHELGHKAMNEAKPQPLRELEAEATAFVVAAVLGLEIPTSRDYLVSWQGTAAELKSAMQTIQRLVRQSVSAIGLGEETLAAAAGSPGR